MTTVHSDFTYEVEELLYNTTDISNSTAANSTHTNSTAMSNNTYYGIENFLYIIA